MRTCVPGHDFSPRKQICAMLAHASSRRAGCRHQSSRCNSSYLSRPTAPLHLHQSSCSSAQHSLAPLAATQQHRDQSLSTLRITRVPLIAAALVALSQVCSMMNTADGTPVAPTLLICTSLFFTTSLVCTSIGHRVSYVALAGQLWHRRVRSTRITS